MRKIKIQKISGFLNKLKIIKLMVVDLIIMNIEINMLIFSG